MYLVRSTFGSIKSTYNSINPATLSGAIDVIVVEHEDGTLACSPFHVRFGKFQLLRPSDKKVVFTVNNARQNLPMKLGEGGEAFFVFETTENIPADLQTSPLASPETSPQAYPVGAPSIELPEPEPLDISKDTRRARSVSPEKGHRHSVSQQDDTDLGALAVTGQPAAVPQTRPVSGDWSGIASHPHDTMLRSVTDETLPHRRQSLIRQFEKAQSMPPEELGESSADPSNSHRSTDVMRATALSRKLWNSKIPSTVTEEGDLMLDMSSISDSEADALKVEAIARKVMSEELAEEEGGNRDIGSRIGLDEDGNIWVYHSEEAKAAADRRAGLQALKYSAAMRSYDALSDPGYHSDEEGQGDREVGPGGISASRFRRDSDSAVGVATPPDSPAFDSGNSRPPTKSYAKTLRLTSDQLKSLNLKPGANPMSFSVNKATCPAYLYLWRHDVPIVISDIDGTITKSDALGHLFNAIGRDWTHLGVAKLYTDIAQNGYNLLYLTSRSVGQADTTRGYLNGVVQEDYKLPKGPVIMSPDRTYAALRREVYLRKPEVFKMACLRDIMGLFQTPATETHPRTPFYAGFGNRVTDAMSYRSVSIPSSRIFTINSNAEVSMHLLAPVQYRTSYVSMRELVDHYFPPVTLLVKEGGEEYTDFNYWRDRPLDIDDFSNSESGSEFDHDEDDARPEQSVRSEDEGGEDMENSFYSRGAESNNDDDVLPGIEGSMYDESLEASLYESMEASRYGEASGMLDQERAALLEEAGYRLEYEDGESRDGGEVEVEIEDAQNSLGALDLASEATPHVRPVSDPAQDDLKDLARVLNSPERRASG